MTITFYKCNDDYRTVNKKLETILSFNNIPNKQDMSVETPTFIMSYSDAYLSDVNYMFIEDFNRYYYTKITAMTGGRIKVSGNVDVLMSFKNQFLSIPCIVARNENIWNGYLNDRFMLQLAYPRIQTKKFETTLISNPKYYLIASGNGGVNT